MKVGDSRKSIEAPREHESRTARDDNFRGLRLRTRWLINDHQIPHVIGNTTDFRLYEIYSIVLFALSSFRNRVLVPPLLSISKPIAIVTAEVKARISGSICYNDQSSLLTDVGCPA